MSIRARLTLAYAVVALITAVVALNLALVYFERRLRGLPPDIAAAVEHRLPIAGGDFDGFAELSVVAAASLTAGLLTALLIARGMTGPLRSVTRAAHQVAGGDLTARAAERAGRDELATLVSDFNAMAASLQALDRERTAASAAVAHELRTPLAALTARLQALHDGVITYDADEPKRLLRHTGVLQRLVDDLRTLSLADAGRLRLDRRVTDLRATVADAVGVHAALAEAESVVLRLGELPATPILVHLDTDRTGQVLTNLIANAVRHTPPFGDVTVTVADAGHWAVVTIDDSGPGIPAADRVQVFDRFTQLDPARREHPTGSGLGLAIVHALVDAHDGRVEITTAPSGGTRVEVRLPQTHDPDQGTGRDNRGG